MTFKNLEALRIDKCGDFGWVLKALQWSYFWLVFRDQRKVFFIMSLKNVGHVLKSKDHRVPLPKMVIYFQCGDFEHSVMTKNRCGDYIFDYIFDYK